MQARRNPFLLLLVLGVCVGIVTAWKDENLKDWDNGWTHNIYGERLDPSIACNGKPCQRYNLTKPERTPFNPNEKFCTSRGDKSLFYCNYLPKNATVVSNDKFGQLVTSEKGFLFPILDHHWNSPFYSNASHHSHSTLQKRGRWALHGNTYELHVWKKTEMTYSITAESSVKDQIPVIAKTIKSALSMWLEACSVGNASEQDDFFSLWKYVPSASTANIWFHIVNGEVCKQPKAIACAFFPDEYPAQRTTILINNVKMKGTYVRDKTIETLAHEIGHTIGLAHEGIDRYHNTWMDTQFDDQSIMQPSVADTNQISGSDCRAMDYYRTGFPTGLRGCIVKKDSDTVVCNKGIVIRQVSPTSTTVKTDQYYIQPKIGGHDELLMDDDGGPCLGGDIKQYLVINPLEASSGGRTAGFVELDFPIAECQAIQVAGDPNYFYAMQSDGNFVGYNTNTGQAISSTASNGLGTKGAYTIIFQSDGNLVIYDAKRKATFSSATYIGGPNSQRLIPSFLGFEGGSFYINDGTGHPMWSSSALYYTYADVSIQLGSTGYCLDAGGSVSGTRVLLWQCNGGANQKWDVYTDGSIRNRASGLCLNNSGNGAYSGSPVLVYTCVGAVNEHWQLLGDGTIASPAVNLCVDNSQSSLFNGNLVQMWNCNAGPQSQQWYVK
ncbi:hypothetical protein BGZ79_009410 [Entomortierella chlamydospora]|nr:hypothetical protein BGZ79_009410 [Entomortierella chlamydospora]